MYCSLTVSLNLYAQLNNILIKRLYMSLINPQCKTILLHLGLTNNRERFKKIMH